MTSTIKVDNIQKVSDGSNIIKKCGSTITLGSSGQTVAIACGATTTGMGRTGTVDWQTSSIKTSTFTAVSGEGYFVNTTGGAITVNLPAGVAGAIVGLKDYAGTWDSNAVTLNPNGSDKIGGGSDRDPTLTAEGGSVLLVFVDSTQGWLTTQQSVTESPSGVETFITASGGNATVTCGNFKTHIFTGSGTFTVSAAATSAPNNVVDYNVVAGAGGGGSNNYGPPRGSGGGGAGGMRFFSTAPGSNHPINNSGASPNTTITVTAQAYPITVGAGGAGAPSGSPDEGSRGNDSIFSTVTSAKGGAGGGHCNMCNRPGASGGGGRNAVCGGTGNTPPTAPPQGNDGGDGGASSGSFRGSGGGGAGGVGTNGDNSDPDYGAGGVGAYIADPFIGPTAPSYGTPGPVSSTRYFAGGGSGAPGPGSASQGPPAGGGGASAVAGTANTGGGGGANPPGAGAAGGSGIVMIRYKFQ
tara:strand:+ start:1268 stop:2671 length:1404 start_codon:yes stop_codon:yes gene_type:complete